MAIRDEMGILKGDLDYGARCPVTVLSLIAPVLYPCVKCRSMTFHLVGEQHAGIWIKVPFARKPIASSGKGYQLICNTCTTIATQLPRSAVAKLEAKVIPHEICDAYRRLEICPEPYTDGYVRPFMSSLENANEDTRVCAGHPRHVSARIIMVDYRLQRAAVRAAAEPAR
jgi:hypothetical protein